MDDSCAAGSYQAHRGAVTAVNSCGAFSGSLAAIGYFFGLTYEQFQKREPSTNASFIGQELHAGFREKFGTAICRDILKKLLGFQTHFMRKRPVRH
jgi:C_GCAxxG_C_C family probable redox protein